MWVWAVRGFQWCSSKIYCFDGDGMASKPAFGITLKLFVYLFEKPLDVYFSADPFNPCRIINLPRRLPQTPWRIRKASVFRFPISDKQVSHFQLLPLLHQNHFSKLDFARKKQCSLISPSFVDTGWWWWVQICQELPTPCEIYPESL